MSKSIKYFKLDEDDILEILIEHFQDQYSEFDCARGIIFGNPANDLRFVVVLGEDCDEIIREIDLKEVDKAIEYNGFHSFIKNNPKTHLKLGMRKEDSLSE